MLISDWVRDNLERVKKLSVTEAKAAVAKELSIIVNVQLLRSIAEEREIKFVSRKGKGNLDRPNTRAVGKKALESANIRDVILAKVLRRLCRSIHSMFDDDFELTPEEEASLTMIIARKTPGVGCCGKKADDGNGKVSVNGVQNRFFS
jgi:hypothetical protein